MHRTADLTRTSLDFSLVPIGHITCAIFPVEFIDGNPRTLDNLSLLSINDLAVSSGWRL
jgi:hypothetical protein